MRRPRRIFPTAKGGRLPNRRRGVAITFCDGGVAATGKPNAWAERALKCGYEQDGFIWNCFGPPGCLKDLFTNLPAAKITRINEFTPAAWAKVKAKDQAVAGPPDMGVTGIFSWPAPVN